MKYTQVYLYIVIGVFVQEKLVNAHGDVHKRTGITWSEASEYCGEDGLEYDKDLLQNANISDGEHFWVGLAIYRIKSPWIEILGCYLYPDSANVTKSQSIVTCQRKCGNSLFFGYMKTTNSCVCLPNSFDTQAFTNIHHCTQQNLTNYIFVYMVYDSLLLDSQHNCATIYCFGGRNNINATDCDETKFSIVGRCDPTAAGNLKEQWDMPYAECKKYCISNDKLLSPSTYCSRNGNENLAFYMWTNVFREELNAKLTKNEARKYKVNEPVGCFFGTKQTIGGSESKLITNRTDCDVLLRWFICKNHSEASSADALPPLTSTQSLHTDSSRDKDVQRTAQEKLKNHTDEQSSLVGGIVGGIFIVIFVVGISLFLCHKRSIGLFKKQTCEMKQKDDFSRAIYESNGQSYSNEEKRSKCNRSYGLVDINTNSNYNEVENQIDNKPVAVDDTYTDTSCGEYDRLNSVENRKNQHNENLYDSNAGIRDTADPTYDTSTNARIVQDGINIYDHTQNIKIDSDYDYSSSVSAVIKDPNDAYDKVS